jgi:uncharacterized protein (DUF433 family)
MWDWIRIMLDGKIIDRGRGPEIAGTRITVYTILEYLEAGWRRDDLAFWFDLTRDQVDDAMQYIEAHKEEVLADYAKIMERINRGNSPELQARLDAAHERFQAVLRERRRVKSQEGHREGNSGGQ